MLSPRRAAIAGTVHATAEHECGGGVFLVVDADVDYTITEWRPAVVNADPSRCHPEEGGDLERGEVRPTRVWLGKFTETWGLYWTRAGHPLATDYEQKLWSAVFTDNADPAEVDELCRQDAEARAEG